MLKCVTYLTIWGYFVPKDKMFSTDGGISRPCNLVKILFSKRFRKGSDLF